MSMHASRRDGWAMSAGGSRDGYTSAWAVETTEGIESMETIVQSYLLSSPATALLPLHTNIATASLFERSSSCADERATTSSGTGDGASRAERVSQVATTKERSEVE